jgi:hypothetical protein
MRSDLFISPCLVRLSKPPGVMQRQLPRNGGRGGFAGGINGLT